MTQLAPDPPAVPSLKPKQQRALTALLAGATDAEAAEDAGVRCETVNRWRHADPDFIAEYNQRRAEMWRLGRDGLRSLISRAVRVLDTALDSDNEKMRLQAAALLFRTVGIGADAMAPASAYFAPTDPGALRRRWAQQRADELADREWALRRAQLEVPSDPWAAIAESLRPAPPNGAVPEPLTQFPPCATGRSKDAIHP